MPQGIVSVSPVATARPSTSSLRTSSIASTLPSPWIATGEARKRSRIRRGFPSGVRVGVVAEMVDVALDRRRRRFELGGARRVELEVGRIDDDVGARQLAELPDLDRRPSGLHGPAPADDQDLADAGGVDRRDRLVGRVRGRELLRRQREHAGDVERDVAVPDHDRALVREVELELLEVGVAVVPGHELGRRPRSGQVLAGDAEAAVGLGADRVDDRVVEPAQLVVRDVPADLDVAEEAKAGLRRGLLERARDRLDVRVVGRDPEADEPPRRRQPLDQVDLDGEVAREQGGGGVEPGRPGADDGDTERIHARESRVRVQPDEGSSAWAVSVTC